MDQVLTRMRYHVVFDLNGVLVRRGAFVKNLPRDIQVRPGCLELLHWVQENATLSFWSSVTSRNMADIMSKLQKSGVRISESTICLCQSSCLTSDSASQSNPMPPHVTNFNEAKTIFLKDLQRILRGQSWTPGEMFSWWTIHRLSAS